MTNTPRPRSSFRMAVNNLAEFPITLFCLFCDHAIRARELDDGIALMREHFGASPLCRERLRARAGEGGA